MKLEEDKIRAYLLGELDPDEAQAVRAAVAADEHWQGVVRDYETLLTGLRAQRVDRYAAEVADPPAAGSSFRFWPVLALLLLGTVAFFLFRPAAPGPESLAKAYFLPPNDPTVAGDVDRAAMYRAGLEAFFREEDYAAAAAAFESLRADTTWGVRAVYYLGHARFLTAEYAAAQAALESSLAQGDAFSRFERRDLAWNVLMTRLAQGEDIGAELRALPDERAEKEGLLRALDGL